MSADPTLPSTPRFTTLAAWLAWQESLHTREIELGLERARSVCERLRLLQPQHPVITVAGTNGKGSSVAMLDAILRAAGYKVGRYTSPHILRYNERIAINDAPVSDADLCTAFAHIDTARGEMLLTYFEFGTLAAFDLFARAQVDVAILEVGLGGRLDAVNILDADVALVATIDIDHVEFLGADRESIGREKAGVFRTRRPAVCSDPHAPQSLIAHAQTTGAPLSLLGRDYHFQVSASGWSWRAAEATLANLPRPNLYGDFQLQNAAGVLMALTQIQSRLPVTRAAIEQGLRTVALAGRYQVYAGAVTWVLDVAHNPQAVMVLAQTLATQPCSGNTHFLVGMLRDKDCSSVFRIMHGLAQAWHLVSLPSRRGASAAYLYEQMQRAAPASGCDVRLYEDIESAYQWCRNLARAGDRVLVFGSFLTVAGIAALLENPAARDVTG